MSDEITIRAKDARAASVLVRLTGAYCPIGHLISRLAMEDHLDQIPISTWALGAEHLRDSKLLLLADAVLKLSPHHGSEGVEL